MKKSRLLLTLTSLSTTGLVATTLASCSCGNSEHKEEETKVTSVSVSLVNKTYFTEGETLSKDLIKVQAKKSDNTTTIVDYNADGVNGYSLVGLDINHVFSDQDVKENFELTVSYKGVTGSTKFTVSAKVETYNENLQYFELQPVVKNKDIVATFSPEEGYVLDWARTGLYIGDKKYTAELNPDIITFDYANDVTKYTMKVAGSVVDSTSVDFGIRCKKPDKPVTDIQLDKSIIHFVSGSSLEDTITATVLPEEATESAVKWEISKGSEYITIQTSGEKNNKCTVKSLGTAGEAEITCTSVSTPSISSKCKIIIEDSSIKLTGEHNFDLETKSYIEISASSTAVSKLYWSTSDSSLVTLQDGTNTGVKVYPTEDCKKYGGYAYVYAKDEQQNVQASFPISFGTFSLLEQAKLKNGIAKWCEIEKSNNAKIVIPSWYIYEEDNKLQGKEIVSYAYSDINVDKITSIFMPYSISNIPNGAFKEWTALTDVIIDYDNAVYTSGGNKDESLNKRFNAVVNKNTKTLIAGCKNSYLDNVDDSPIEKIGTEAFSLTGLTTLNIPANIKEIEKLAFENCGTLTNLTFSGVTNSKWTISNDDHSICQSLFLDTSATEAATQLKDNAALTWNNINYVEFKEVTDTETGTVSYEVYTEEANTDKMVGKLVIPSKHNDKDVTGIYYNESTEAGGFEFCNKLTSVYIPSTITYISMYAFRECTELSECTIENLEYTDRGSFHLTGSLKSINIINNNIIGLGIGSFAESGIKKFTIPATCTTIGRSCFYQSRLTECTIIKPTTGYCDWRCLESGKTISINEYCISKGKESIYTNVKVAADMLRYPFSETAKYWGFAEIFWDTTII